MIKLITINGEEFINVPADITTLVEMGLTESEARQAIIDETKQDIVIAIRMKRAPLIAEADIMINTAIDRNEDVAALRAYRQALRDVPQHYLATGKVEFPDKP